MAMSCSDLRPDRCDKLLAGTVEGTIESAMKPRAYIETSVLSYISARPSRDPITQFRLNLSKRWWEQERDKYELVVSDVVEAECQRGDAEQVALRQALRHRWFIGATIC
jgi:hypothetical protein